MDRSLTGSLAAKLPLESPLHRMRRYDEGARVVKRCRQSPPKNIEVSRRKILRVIQRQEVMKHEHVAKVVPTLQPPEKDRVFEPMLRDIEIDRAVRDAERPVVKDASSAALPASLSLTVVGLARMPTRFRQVAIGRRREPVQNSRKGRLARAAGRRGPPRPRQVNDSARLLNREEMRSPQPVMQAGRHGAEPREMRCVGKIDPVDPRRSQLRQSRNQMGDVEDNRPL